MDRDIRPLFGAVRISGGGIQFGAKSNSVGEKKGKKMNIGVDDCVTVLGTRGTGKSTVARKINKMWPRSVIIDPVEDWTDGEVVTSFPVFARRLKELKNEHAKKFRLIFRFNPDDDPKIKQETFNQVLRLAFNFRHLQVVIDEIQLFATPQFLPEQLKNLLFIGRHRGISVVCITQRPGQLNKSILAQSFHVFVGQLHERNDLRVISDFLNIDEQKIINLEKFRFFHFSPGKKIQEIKIQKN